MESRERNPRIYLVASGKGGVGKTVVCANLAVALASEGQRVLVLDADLGLANLDILLGLTPQWNLRHVLERSHTLKDIVLTGPAGIEVLPASSGLPHLADLPREHSLAILQALGALAHEYDTVLIDAPSGVGVGARRFIELADELVVITTPEPTSVTDAYALVKVASMERPELKQALLVNMAQDAEEGRRTAEAVSAITQRFLGFPIPSLGFLPWDERVPLAVRRQKTFMLSDPLSAASRHIRLLARQIGAPREAVAAPPAVEFQWPNRIKKWLNINGEEPRS